MEPRERLLEAILAALDRTDLPRSVEVTGIALDMHPWHGFLNLGLRTDDHRPYPASWRYGHLHQAHGVGNWPEGRAWADWMHGAFEAARRGAPERSYSDLAAPFFADGAWALGHPRVRDALRRFRRREPVRPLLYDPDVEGRDRCGGWWRPPDLLEEDEVLLIAAADAHRRQQERPDGPRGEAPADRLPRWLDWLLWGLFLAALAAAYRCAA